MRKKEYLSYLFDDICVYGYYFKNYRNIKKYIKVNSEYAGKYAGQRCFVLGNGPSLKLYDVSVLENEKVFCVNEFFKFEQADMVKPDYYLFTDSIFFDTDPNGNDGDNAFSNELLSFVDKHENMEMFIPVQYNESWLAEKNKARIRYYYAGRSIELLQNKKIDFAKVSPSAQAVIQVAIELAIYMGFSEIYLLGTDQTNIFGHLKAYMNSNQISDYAFDTDEKYRQWKNNLLRTYPLHTTLNGYARIFQVYDELYNYCVRNNVQIYNCAPESLIQNIPYKNFLDLKFT